MIKQRLIAISLALFVQCTWALPLEKIHLPPGFHISLYAKVPNARQMALAPNGVLFVGTNADKVYAIVKTKAGETNTILLAKGLDLPHGVAFYKGDLFVAEVGRILQFQNILQHLNSPGKPKVVFDALPHRYHHGAKTINFGPDDKLYIAIGAPCNVCLSKDPRFGIIARLNPDGSGFEMVARGVRNSVGFDWSPTTHQLWFTDNGRDLLGDNFPPDELNHAPTLGLHFGFPYVNGNNIPDPTFGTEIKKGMTFTPPVQLLDPHVAALGMTFYKGDQFPKAYQQVIFIAEHGSWNRSKKIGYRVTQVTLKNNKPIDYKPFADGWLEPKEKVWGRPVDVIATQQGDLLISDDYAGAIYKITYRK